MVLKGRDFALDHNLNIYNVEHFLYILFIYV